MEFKHIYSDSDVQITIGSLLSCVKSTFSVQLTVALVLYDLLGGGLV